MRVKTTLAAALAALFAALLAGPAAADVIHVGPGESIQAAIDQANPGDTIEIAPGTYQQNVQIKKDGITLRGAGADKTVLEGGGPVTPVDPICTGEEGGVTGICVADATITDPNPPVVNNEIRDVQIKDLAVVNFGGDGVFFFGTRDQRVIGVLAQNNGGYGIVAFDTTGGEYFGNVTPANVEAGIYVGDSPQANAVVRGNVSFSNKGFGIFVRDAAHGTVKDNDTFGNCAGILFLDTPDDPTDPHPATDWTARRNTADHNNADCPGEGDEPGVSGIGIAILGAKRITLEDNTANGNAPAAGSQSFASGGIFVGSDGPLIAEENTIAHNTAFGNSPVDLLWDQTPGNQFTANRCQTSNPDGLCTLGGNGHGHGGDHGNGGDHGSHGDQGNHDNHHKHGGHHKKHGKHHKKHGKHHKHGKNSKKNKNRHHGV